MDRDQLKALPASDRWVFLRGRIVSDSVDMDAALRGLHAALRGRDDRKALLDAPANWTEAVKKCRQLLDRYEPIDADMRGAIHSAIDAAAEAWSERNRYMHDLLDARIQGNGASGIRRRRFPTPRAGECDLWGPSPGAG